MVNSLSEIRVDWSIHFHSFSLSFAYQEPAIWNDLPFDLRHKDSLSTFNSALKTHLFTIWLMVLVIIICAFVCMVVVIIIICALCVCSCCAVFFFVVLLYMLALCIYRYKAPRANSRWGSLHYYYYSITQVNRQKLDNVTYCALCSCRWKQIGILTGRHGNHIGHIDLGIHRHQVGLHGG